MLSEAVAEIVTIPETVSPSVGAVSVAVGAVVSSGAGVEVFGEPVWG